jgi:uncharacterized delta-60 repeat protein
MNEQLLNSLRHACRAAPTAALATGIVCPVALGDPGDLDPGFADVGRYVAPTDNGIAQTVETQDENILFTGGELVLDFYFGDSNSRGFAGRLSGTGMLDVGFAAPGLDDVFVRDTAVQSDGKIVGVGRRTVLGRSNYLAFRLERDGAFDAGFGVDGIVALAGVSGVSSIVVDPGGTIVLAGWQGGDLKVMRLLDSGALDASFGTTGVFTAPAESADEQVMTAPRILLAEGGGYRVTDNDYTSTGVPRCRVLALTATGTVDTTFGDQGYTGFGSTTQSVTCESIAELPDGRLLIAGSQDAQPLVVRLIASGAADATFAAADLGSTTMTAATAVALDPNDGSVVVAGQGPSEVPGVLVARLQADGALDTAFGVGGATWVDLPSDGQQSLVVKDATVLPNSDVLIAGGSPAYFGSNPFVARLVGSDGTDSPGVLGFMDVVVDATEDAQQATVTVRRMGGKTGDVSVAWEAKTIGTDAYSAGADDFTAESGLLEWAEGDVADKQIVVTIAADDGSPEETEIFAVELSDAQGSVGIGSRVATIGIVSDAPPAGMFAIEGGDQTVAEGSVVAQFWVSRGYYYSGEVSVSVTATSGSATAGDDFTADPVTVTFADGDAEWKLIEIPIVNDSSDELLEDFAVQLSSPTGGAITGPRSSATIAIADDDAAPPRSGDGGGGRTGLLSLLLLGAARLLRSVRRRRPSGMNDGSRL